MKREAEIEVMSIALIILQEAEGRRKDPYVDGAKITWRTLDALADAFRKGGAEPGTPSLGAKAREDEELTADEELVAARVETEHEQELDRKLRERPEGGE